MAAPDAAGAPASAAAFPKKVRRKRYPPPPVPEPILFGTRPWGEAPGLVPEWAVLEHQHRRGAQVVVGGQTHSGRSVIALCG